MITGSSCLRVTHLCWGAYQESGTKLDRRADVVAKHGPTHHLISNLQRNLSINVVVVALELPVTRGWEPYPLSLLLGHCSGSRIGTRGISGEIPDPSGLGYSDLSTVLDLNSSTGPQSVIGPHSTDLIGPHSTEGPHVPTGNFSEFAPLA